MGTLKGENLLPEMKAITTFKGSSLWEWNQLLLAQLSPLVAFPYT